MFAVAVTLIHVVTRIFSCCPMWV